MRTTSIVQSRSFSLFAAFATLLWSIPGNVDAGQGIALLKSRQDQLEEYWTALPFQSRESYVMADNFRPVGKVNPISIPKNEIGKVIDLPDLTAGSFLGDTDFAAVSAKRKELQDAAKRFKAAAPALMAAARTLEVAEQQFAAGNVMRNGKWISSDEWKKAQKVDNPQAATVATITVNGKTYSDVRLTSFRGETTGIMHAGGIGTFLTSALSDQQIVQLNATSQTVKIDKSKPIVAVMLPAPPATPPTTVSPLEETPKIDKDALTLNDHKNAQLNATSQSVQIDLITLKSGEKIEGKIISENAESVQVEYHLTPKIKDTKTILKSSIAGVVKQSKPVVVTLPTPAEETPEVDVGTVAGSKPLATENERGEPTTETIRAGIARFDKAYSKLEFRKGDLLESRGSAVMPAGTVIYPVKIETQGVSLVFYLFKDGFGDWQCMVKGSAIVLPCKK